MYRNKDGSAIHTDAKNFTFVTLEKIWISPSFDDNNNPALGP